MLTQIEMRAHEAVIGIANSLRQRPKVDWEQRRYEIARDCLAAFFSRPAKPGCNLDVDLESAVDIANSAAIKLIEKLKDNDGQDSQNVL